MSHAGKSCRKKITQTEIAVVIVTPSRSFPTPHIILCHLAVIVSGVRLPLRIRNDVN